MTPTRMLSKIPFDTGRNVPGNASWRFRLFPQAPCRVRDVRADDANQAICWGVMQIRTDLDIWQRAEPIPFLLFKHALEDDAEADRALGFAGVRARHYIELTITRLGPMPLRGRGAVLVDVELSSAERERQRFLRKRALDIVSKIPDADSREILRRAVETDPEALAAPPPALFELRARLMGALTHGDMASLLAVSMRSLNHEQVGVLLQVLSDVKKLSSALETGRVVDP